MLEEERSKIEDAGRRIRSQLGKMDVGATQEKIHLLREDEGKPEVYGNHEKAKAIAMEIKRLERRLEPWLDIKSKQEDLLQYLDMAAEEADLSVQGDIQKELVVLERDLGQLETLAVFKEPTDFNNAYFSLHSGAGGTEACDWALMLYRMYMRWMERRQYKVSLVDYQGGEEAGIKSATLHVVGDYAHGHLKAETGVHRLVRISPFDSAKRRHTSFCSVLSVPEVSTELDVEIAPSDLRVDTFRAGGAGGQHVNKTDSAVRLTHIETGIVVSCQAERSQFQNKERAMKILKARLVAHREQEAEKKKATPEKKKIEWGSQIRSYVFHPYNLVKDHRTGFESSNTAAVMDGDLDSFIEAWLKA